MASRTASRTSQPHSGTSAGTWRQVLTHPLFEGVAEQAVAPALRETGPRLTLRNRLVSTPETGHGRLHLLLKGCLLAYRLNPAGHQLLLEIIDEGGVDGIQSVAGRPGHFTEALTDSEIVSLSRQQLTRLGRADPRVTQNLLALAAAKLEDREGHMESMAVRGIPALARLLLTMGRSIGKRKGATVVLWPRLTHQMLADMLGIRRETVSLMFPALTRAGAVRVQRRGLILDSETLQDLADRERAPVRVDAGAVRNRTALRA